MAFVFISNTEYHLLKRQTKHGKIYYAAFLSDRTGKNGKKLYKKIISTKVEIGRAHV